MNMNEKDQIEYIKQLYINKVSVPLEQLDMYKIPEENKQNKSIILTSKDKSMISKPSNKNMRS